MAGVRNRVFGSTITCCMFAVGEILLGLIASWLRSWRMILRVVYGPALLAVFLPLLVPESIRSDNLDEYPGPCIIAAAIISRSISDI